ncbi:hypothetical protein K8I61_02685 [bacterium]|nr:hypothetical protein [bacterium]
MVKLILRYLIAIVMIPVGVLLGIGGVIQNRVRRADYEKRRQALATHLAEGPP